MKKYKFSLQPVLNLKESIEKQQKSELSKVIKQKEKLIQDKNLLEYNKDRYLAALKEISAKGIKAEQMKMYNDYIGHISALIKEKNNRINSKVKEEENIKSELLSTIKEKKIFNTLKEKNYRNYLYEITKLEEKNIDEVVCQKYSKFLATGV